MAYPVNSVADYVIEYTRKKENFVNNLKLQKILYYLEARFLIEGKGNLFEETIEKWRYGPVVPEVYYRFNHLGAEDIMEVPQGFDFMSLLEGNVVEEHSPAFSFEGEEKVIIEETIEKLLTYKAFDLVNETHKHKSWLKDEERILAGIRSIPYDKDDILKDFGEYPQFQLWNAEK